jgi:hypothetical protein
VQTFLYTGTGRAMAGIPVEPFRLSFEGLDADANRIDALYLGESLQGTARIYNSVLDFHFHGQIRNHTQHDIRIHVGPPKRGSLMYTIYLMLVHGKMPLYPELFFELAGLLVPATVKALVARKSGQTKVLEKTLDQMHDVYVRYDEFARRVHDDNVQEKGRLLGMVERLAELNNRPLANMAAPVGRSVQQSNTSKVRPTRW